MTKKEQNFRQLELNPGPLTCEVIALFIVPQHQLFNVYIKLIMFNVFVHEILLVDAVWSWQSSICQEFKDNNIQGK